MPKLIGNLILALLLGEVRPIKKISIFLVREKKCLVVDPKQSGSLSVIIQTLVLKDDGVEICFLGAEPVQTDYARVVYLVRLWIDLMKIISALIHYDITKGVQREYSAYFVPHQTVD
ncbi:hypothetical protein Sjap_020245 [Stephania japonica]|uniref:Uncharacterized protein n=1 Tax=Stephania japonica TaxID=461633 RepID=A0AAP0I039_9MAGN